MYLYLAVEDAFEELPDGLLVQFGTPLPVMQLDLHPGRSLSRADVIQVIHSLHDKGYYLQMPPKIVPDMYHGNDF